MMKKWYALKVFYNRFSEIKATLSRDGIESYIPMKTRSYPQPDGEVVIRPGSSCRHVDVPALR